MSEDPQFEDQLVQALTRAGEEFRTEPAPLVAAGLAHGRRLRRRRVAAMTGAAAVLAVVATGGAVALSFSGSSSPATVAAATSPTATASASPVPSASRSASPGGAVGTVAKDEVLNRLKALLPAGTVTEKYSSGNEPLPIPGTTRAALQNPAATVLFDDGHGLAQMAMCLTFSYQTPPKPGSPYLSASDFYDVSVLPDGSTLVLLKGYEYPNNRATAKDWEAELYRPDGVMVAFSEWNSSQDKGAPSTRVNPPLSIDQVKTLVTDPSWQQVVAEMGPRPPLERHANPPGTAPSPTPTR